MLFILALAGTISAIAQNNENNNDINMNIKELITQRHAVRHYKDKEIPDEVVAKLQQEIDKCNSENGLNFRFVQDEPKALKSGLFGLYRFTGVRNYIVLIGPDNPEALDKIGYFGEQLVIKIQAEGLNTCWVGGSYKFIQETMQVNDGEQLYCIICVGYGKDNGKPHKSKSIDDVVDVGDYPEWFYEGVKGALLAPTALNRQHFKFSYKDNCAYAVSPNNAYDRLSLGIVKFHFEMFSGHKLIIYTL